MNSEACQNENNAVEKCVLCGKETEYTFGVPIQERNYYVSGCGQLCKQCYLEVEVPETV